MNNYQLYEEIGKGRHSTVYKGRKKKTIEYYAIASIDKSQRPRVLKSVHILRSLSHKTIVQFHNWYETNNYLWVITALCTGGNLRSILQTEQKLPENSVRILAADIAEGLCYMHSKSVLYADLKPSNILFDSHGQIKFYDFDLSTLFSSAGNGSDGRVGTPSYMAPELFEEGGVLSIASDLWSFGCLLYEMVVGHPPFIGSDIKELIDNIMNRPFERLPDVSEGFNTLLECLLTKDPAERGDWTDISASDFFPRLSLLGNNTGYCRFTSDEGTNNSVSLSREAFPPQPAFENFLKRLEADKKAGAVAAAKASGIRHAPLNGHAIRASINAERNRRSKHHRCTGEDVNVNEKNLPEAGSGIGTDPTKNNTYNEQAMVSGVKLDEEMDFRDPSVVELSEEGSLETSGRNNIKSEPPKKYNNTTTTLAKPQLSPDGILPKVQVKIRAPEKAASQIITPAPCVRSNKVTCVEELAIHIQDAYLRPLVNNSRIERYSHLQYDPSIITVKQPTSQQLRDMPDGDLGSYLTSVYTVLSCQSNAVSLDTMYATMCFFETLCCDSVVAEKVVNSQLTDLFLSFFSTTAPPQANTRNDIAIRVQAATVLGLLVRHAENIQYNGHESFIGHLIKALEVETATKVRRRLLACLGELIFFIATRPDDERVQWTVDSGVVGECLLKCLKDPDEAMTHYAAKIIENVVSLNTSTCPSVIYTSTKMFGIGNKDFIVFLLTKYDAADWANGKTEHLRIALSCAALKLAQTEGRELFGEVFEWISFSPDTFFRDIIQEGHVFGDVSRAGCKHSLKTIQAYLTCCIVFCGKWMKVATDTERRADVKMLMRNLQWTACSSSQLSMTCGLFSTSLDDVSFFSSHRASLFLDSILRCAPEAIEILYECSTAPVRGKAVLLASLLCLIDNEMEKTDSDDICYKAGSHLPLLLSIFSGSLSTQSSVKKLVLREKDEYVRRTLNFIITVSQIYTMNVLSSCHASAVKAGSRTPKWFKEQLQVVKYTLGTSHSGKNPASEFLLVPFQLSSVILSIAKLLEIVSTNVHNVDIDSIEIAQDVIQLVEIVQQELSEAAATDFPGNNGAHPSSVVTCIPDSDVILVVSSLFPALLPFISETTVDIPAASQLTYIALKCVSDLTICIINYPQLCASSMCGSLIVDNLNTFMVEVGKNVPRLLRYGNKEDGKSCRTTEEEADEMVTAMTLKLLSAVCERFPSVAKIISDKSVLDLLFPFIETKVINLHVVSLLVSLLRAGEESLLEYAVTEHKLMQTAIRILQEYLPSWEIMEPIVESTVEIIYLVLCSAVKNPTSQAARSCGHLLAGADSTPLETSVFIVCIRHTSSPASDKAANIIFMVCQLFNEARKLMVIPRVLAQVREIINASCSNVGVIDPSINCGALSSSRVQSTISVEGFSPNTAIPVFRALMIVAKLLPGQVQSDELLLVQIQYVSETCVHSQLKTLANDLLLVIFQS